MSLIEDFKHMKWLPLAGGALLCVLGLTALVWPGRVAFSCASFKIVSG